MAAAYQDQGNLTKQSFVHKGGDRQNFENTSLANPTGRGDLPCFASWLRPNEIWHCCPPFCNVLCTADQQKQKSTRSGGVCSLFVFELQCNQGKKPLSLSPSFPVSAVPPGFTPPRMALLKEEAVTILLYSDNAFPEESISFRR